MEKDQFQVVSRKSAKKRPAKEMDVDEVDIEKMLEAEMNVPEPKMPQFKATKEVGIANQVCWIFSVIDLLIQLINSKRCAG